MDNKTHKSQAQKIASKSGAGKPAPSKAGNSAPSSKVGPKTEKHNIPIRLISSLVFAVLFILFFITFIEVDGLLLVSFDKFVHGMFGKVGFVLAIPVLLYLFIIHAFSGKRPVKMRTSCLIAFVILCSSIAQLIVCSDYNTLEDGFGLLSDLYEKGKVGDSGGLVGGWIAVILQILCGNGDGFDLLLHQLFCSLAAKRSDLTL